MASWGERLTHISVGKTGIVKRAVVVVHLLLKLLLVQRLFMWPTPHLQFFKYSKLDQNVKGFPKIMGKSTLEITGPTQARGTQIRSPDERFFTLLNNRNHGMGYMCFLI